MRDNSPGKLKPKILEFTIPTCYIIFIVLVQISILIILNDSENQLFNKNTFYSIQLIH